MLMVEDSFEVDETSTKWRSLKGSGVKLQPNVETRRLIPIISIYHLPVGYEHSKMATFEA